jgi:hypothetical protein
MISVHSPVVQKGHIQPSQGCVFVCEKVLHQHHVGEGHPHTNDKPTDADAKL